jgi:hypothetical protein
MSCSKQAAWYQYLKKHETVCHSALDAESRVSRENGNPFPYSSLLPQGRRLDSCFRRNDDIYTPKQSFNEFL